MRTKKSFVENCEVLRVAGEMEACLKICHKIYIDWRVFGKLPLEE